MRNLFQFSVVLFLLAMAYRGHAQQEMTFPKGTSRDVSGNKIEITVNPIELQGVLDSLVLLHQRMADSLHAGSSTGRTAHLVVQESILSQGLLEVLGEAEFASDVDVLSALAVYGQSQFMGEMTIVEEAAFQDALSVAGYAQFGSWIQVDGATTLDNTLEVTGATDLKAALNVDGASTLKSTLDVDGATDVNNSLTVDGTTDLNDALTVDGASVLNSTLNVVGGADLDATLNVDGASTLKSTLAVDGATDLNNTLTVDGTADLNDALTVDGASVLNSTLNVVGGTDLDATLNVDGASTLKSTLAVDGATDLNNTLTVDGTTDLNDALIVDGASVLNSTLNVVGVVDLDATFNVDGASTLKNTLAVDGATDLNNTLTVDGMTDLNDALTVDGASVLNGTLNVVGAADLDATLNVDGASTLKSTLAVDGASDLNNTLTVDGTTDLNDALTVDGAAMLNNTLTVVGATDLDATLNVDGASTLKSTLAVDGTTDLNNTLTVDGTTELNGALTVDGASTLNSTLNVVGAADLDATLNVDGASTLKNTLAVDGATDLNDALTVDGASILNSTLNVLGAADLDATLNVDGASTLKNTLAVDGATVLNDALTVDGASILNSTLNVVGAADLDATLNVDGASTLKSTLSVDGATDLNNALTVDGATDLNDALTVDGASILNSTLNVVGAADLDATLNVDGASTLKSTLSVDGMTDLNNALTVEGTTDLNNALTVEGASTLKSTLAVDGSTDLNNALTVEGPTDLYGALTVDGATGLNGTLSVQGFSNLLGLEVTSSAFLDYVVIDSGLDVEGGDVHIDHHLIVEGSSTLFGPAYLQSLNVGGPASFNHSLIVDGPASMTENLEVLGDATIFGDLNAPSLSLQKATVTDSLIVSGRTTLDTTNILGQLVVQGHSSASHDAGDNVPALKIQLEGQNAPHRNTNFIEFVSGGNVLGRVEGMNIGQELLGYTEAVVNAGIVIISAMATEETATDFTTYNVDITGEFDAEEATYDIDDMNDPVGAAMATLIGNFTTNFGIDMISHTKAVAKEVVTSIIKIVGCFWAGAGIPDLIANLVDLGLESLDMFLTIWGTAGWAGTTPGTGGIAYESVGADYAEWLPKAWAAEALAPGVIVGVNKGEISKSYDTAERFMVISTNPTVVGAMPEAGTESAFAKVAFMGQVPTRVLAPVKRGDFILPSGQQDGLGMAVAPEDMRSADYRRIVGIAWSDSEPGDIVSDINVAVGFQSNAIADKVSQLEQAVAEVQQILMDTHPEAQSLVKHKVDFIPTAPAASPAPNPAAEKEQFVANERTKAYAPAYTTAVPLRERMIQEIEEKLEASGAKEEKLENQISRAFDIAAEVTGRTGVDLMSLPFLKEVFEDPLNAEVRNQALSHYKQMNALFDQILVAAQRENDKKHDSKAAEAVHPDLADPFLLLRPFDEQKAIQDRVKREMSTPTNAQP